MQRVTITIDDDLVAELERHMAAHGYANRSEAIRDLARSGLQQRAIQGGARRVCRRPHLLIRSSPTRTAKAANARLPRSS